MFYRRHYQILTTKAVEWIDEMDLIEKSYWHYRSRREAVGIAAGLVRGVLRRGYRIWEGGSLLESFEMMEIILMLFI